MSKEEGVREKIEVDLRTEIVFSATRFSMGLFGVIDRKRVSVAQTSAIHRVNEMLCDF